MKRVQVNRYNMFYRLTVPVILSRAAAALITLGTAGRLFGVLSREPFESMIFKKKPLALDSRDGGS